ncbi:unnamed protein product [Fraxinus pennsylvanica]|uniref:RRM domain-containing protein n=1 Tax=Fraxinus pennsylvanica TaxID=56036 RepID=A0AAD1Z4W9_9LAMI|nr:unnamed protein product [Fraxinus pennsylvanica]
MSDGGSIAVVGCGVVVHGVVCGGWFEYGGWVRCYVRWLRLGAGVCSRCCVWYGVSVWCCFGGGVAGAVWCGDGGGGSDGDGDGRGGYYDFCWEYIRSSGSGFVGGGVVVLMWWWRRCDSSEKCTVSIFHLEGTKMAFVNRIGNVLKNTLSKHVRLEVSASNPVLFQAIRSMSSSKLFVGGLSYNMDEMSLREAFSGCGEVVEARIIMDRETGRSRGFGFVTYTSTDEASSAIQELDGQELQGRRIRVNYATEKPRGGGFGGGFGAGGGFNYGGNYGGSGGYQGGNFGGGGGGNYPRADGNFGGGGGYGGNNYPSGGGGFGGGSSYPSGDGGFGGGSSYPSGDGGFGGGKNYPSGGGGHGGESGFSAPGYGGTPETYREVQEQVGGNQIGTETEITDFGDDMDANDRNENEEPNDYANTRS